MVRIRKTSMSASPKMAREKLSTTVSAETYRFLQEMVDQGQAGSLAEAVDSIVSRIRRLENRRRLADATAHYFERLDPKAQADERALAEGLSAAAGAIDFDTDI
jgi:hypothetical protein